MTEESTSPAPFEPLQAAPPDATSSQDPSAGLQPGSALSLVTLGRFLVGDATAIRIVSQARFGWLLGALFVASAGLAREYDRSDLMAEPYHLALPFAASILTALTLYGLLRLYAAIRAPQPGPRPVEFLQTYWATAPLAWLYALPVESVLDAGSSAAANFLLLGLVAAWRVALMIRIVQTLFGVDCASSVALVGAFADLVLILALAFSPVPVLDIMSGNRLNSAEKVIQQIHLFVTLAAWLSIPLWLAGLGAAGRWSIWTPVPRLTLTPPIRATTYGVAIGAIAAGIGLCAVHQPAWQRSTAIRRQVDRQDFSGALQRLSEWSEKDFPRHWELPPNPSTGYSAKEPRTLIRFYLAALESPQTPDWVRAQLQDKVLRAFTSYFLAHEMIEALSNQELEALVLAMESARDQGMQIPGHWYLRFEDDTPPERAKWMHRLEKAFRTND